MKTRDLSEYSTECQLSEIVNRINNLACEKANGMAKPQHIGVAESPKKTGGSDSARRRTTVVVQEVA
jgi:hypothetical protein